MDALEVRVSRLERTARRWRLTAFVFGVGLAGLGAARVANDGVFDVVRAKTFAVVDDNGKPYAVFSSDVDEAKPDARYGMVMLQADDGTRGVLVPGSDYKWKAPAK
jgi:hypothetical protein